MIESLRSPLRIAGEPLTGDDQPADKHTWARRKRESVCYHHASMMPPKLSSLTVRRLFGVVFLFVFTACGGIAVFDDGPVGGAGGAGTNGTATTGGGSTKCVSGVCGDSCVRCEGSDCKAGRCDKSLTCVVALTAPTCN